MEGFEKIQGFFFNNGMMIRKSTVILSSGRLGVLEYMMNIFFGGKGGREGNGRETRYCSLSIVYVV